jgi:hypothetical protein
MARVGDEPANNKGTPAVGWYNTDWVKKDSAPRDESLITDNVRAWADIGGIHTDDEWQ